VNPPEQDPDGPLAGECRGVPGADPEEPATIPIGALPQRFP
jgi:hypothetical protein